MGTRDSKGELALHTEIKITLVQEVLPVPGCARGPTATQPGASAQAV